MPLRIAVSALMATSCKDDGITTGGAYKAIIIARSRLARFERPYCRPNVTQWNRPSSTEDSAAILGDIIALGLQFGQARMV